MKGNTDFASVNCALERDVEFSKAAVWSGDCVHLGLSPLTLKLPHAYLWSGTWEERQESDSFQVKQVRDSVVSLWIPKELSNERGQGDSRALSR